MSEKPFKHGNDKIRFCFKKTSLLLCQEWIGESKSGKGEALEQQAREHLGMHLGGRSRGGEHLSCSRLLLKMTEGHLEI